MENLAILQPNDLAADRYVEGDRKGRPYGKKRGVFVRPYGENISLVLADICGHTSEFCEITVEKDKEKLKIMLDFLLG